MKKFLVTLKWKNEGDTRNQSLCMEVHSANRRQAIAATLELFMIHEDTVTSVEISEK